MSLARGVARHLRCGDCDKYRWCVVQADGTAHCYNCTEELTQMWNKINKRKPRKN